MRFLPARGDAFEFESAGLRVRLNFLVQSSVGDDGVVSTWPQPVAPLDGDGRIEVWHAENGFCVAVIERLVGELLLVVVYVPLGDLGDELAGWPDDPVVALFCWKRDAVFWVFVFTLCCEFLALGELKRVSG